MLNNVDVRPTPKQKRKKKPVDKMFSLTSFEQLKTEKTPKLYVDSSMSSLLSIDSVRPPITKSNVNNNKNGINAFDIFESLKTSDSSDSNNLRDVNFAFTPSTTNPTADDPSYASKSDGLPGPPQDLRAPVVKARFVILTWNPPIVNNEDIIAYSAYYRQEGSKRYVKFEY